MAIVDTLGIADELARDGVFSREQAERLARVSGRAATETLVTKNLESALALLRKDLEANTALLRNVIAANTVVLRNKPEARLEGVAKELVKWFAKAMVVHGIAVIGGIVTLVKLL